MKEAEKQAILALDDVEVERMWQLALHEEQVLNERSGLFLVANAMLLIFAVEASSRFSVWVTLAAMMCGLLMCLFWIIINERQVDEMKRAARIVRVRSAGFKIYDASALPGIQKELRKHGARLFAVGVPVLVLLIWLVMILDTARKIVVYG